MNNYPDFCELIQRRADAQTGMLTEPPGESMVACIKRQLDRESDAVERKWISLSQLGSCARKLWYRKVGEPESGREIYFRTRLTWMQGDLIEFILSSMLAEALATYEPEWSLWHWKYGDQQESRFVMPGGQEITGHSDGLLYPHSEFYPKVIWSVKSQSSYGFNRWRDQGGPLPSDGEWWQAQGELLSHGLDDLYICTMSKDSGQPAGYWVHRDPNYPDMLQEHLQMVDMKQRMLPDGTVLHPEPSLTPAKKQPKKDHNKLPWQCCYCPYYKKCWGDDLVDTVQSDWRGNPSTKLFIKDPDRQTHPGQCPCPTCLYERGRLTERDPRTFELPDEWKPKL